jgi:hypothetical protein
MFEQNKIDVKIVGVTGQISIGKEYAGQQVQVLKQDEGTWVIKKGRFIPDNERWLYKGDNLQRLEKAIKSAENRKRVNNSEELLAKFERAVSNE